MQEPLSVLFSLLNLLAHKHGLAELDRQLPRNYSLAPYYRLFGYFGILSWICSMVFHTRDFDLTEKADYLAAGASIFYGLYYSPIRIFRLDQPRFRKDSLTTRSHKSSVLRVWTFFCVTLYAAHALYLTCWRWDYTYNMAANVAVGIAQNVLWTWYSVARYRRLKKPWAAWPGLIVAWITLAMSLELLDFPPLGGYLDAHSLWHAGTVLPTLWWYEFLVRDAKEDVLGERVN
ncbi:MAG: hypothetical protein M1837_001555 [Sclerophora amabilis]|nr:MAG: hypothetical protein M1837_001555 [Sclerophora amabilis]